MCLMYRILCHRSSPPHLYHPFLPLLPPSLSLSLSLLLQEAEVIILLTQTSTEKSIGFYVCRTKDDVADGAPLTNSNVIVVNKSPFRKDFEVSLAITLSKGAYQIVPCTFSAGEKGPFTLTVMCSNNNAFQLDLYEPSNPPSSSSSSSDKKALSSPSSSSSSSALASKGQWEFGSINWSDVKIGKKVGQGAFGAVYLGEWLGRRVAIKKLFRDDVDEAELATFRKEIEIMSRFSHPKIVQFLGASLQQPNICILTEFMERGNLSCVMKNDPNLPWSRKLSMSLDAAEGMEYLHSQNPPVVHRDLKSLNLLVSDDFTVKVADFGLSKATSGNSLNSKVGSLNWCAPEILLRSAPYTKAGDVYSYGMVWVCVCMRVCVCM